MIPRTVVLGYFQVAPSGLDFRVRAVHAVKALNGLRPSVRAVLYTH